jgi:prepilin-type processing-associated H-X9-DG protein
MRITESLRRTLRRCGFTLPELVAILVISSTLILLAPPLFARNHGAGSAAICLYNLRQLTRAWQLYASDNSDRLAHNYHGGLAQGGAGASGASAAPWAVGWLDWTSSPDNTNQLFIRNAKYTRLAPYISAEENIHKCPSDVYLSSAQRSRGWPARIRSYSMNLTVGDGNAPSGPWDARIYTQAKVLSAFVNPAPSESNVFLEEHADSMNDPALFPPNAGGWVDWPASYHQNACNFSFADGHAETHIWKRSLRDDLVTTTSAFSPRVTAGDPDRTWLSYRSQRVSATTY